MGREREITINWENKFKRINDIINSHGVALYGAGANGRWAYEYLSKIGVDVHCFVDNSPRKGYFGVPSISENEYRTTVLADGIPILITAKHAVLPILQLLSDVNDVMPFDAWFYLARKDDYNKLRSMFCDDKSLATFDALIKTMMSGDEDYCANEAVPNQYFNVPGFFNTAKEIFADIGAFTGDTVERFIWEMNGTFRHIYAFEPGPQIRAAKVRFKRLVDEWGFDPMSITLENYAIGSKDTVGSLDGTLCRENQIIETNISEESSNSMVRIITLDTYFQDKEITFLKADIEGAEVEMLKGGKNTICEQQPKLAICTYHRPDDMINIMKILSTYVPEYHFFLRHHSSLAMDTVLYCKV